MIRRTKKRERKVSLDGAAISMHASPASLGSDSLVWPSAVLKVPNYSGPGVSKSGKRKKGK